MRRAICCFRFGMINRRSSFAHAQPKQSTFMQVKQCACWLSSVSTDLQAVSLSMRGIALKFAASH